MSTSLARSRRIAPQPARTKDSRAQFFGASPALRAARLRARAAAMMATLTEDTAAKQYAPLLSPQDVSALRNTGGSVGEAAVTMFAGARLRGPDFARVIAEFFDGVASLAAAGPGAPLPELLSAEVRKDTAEDVAQDDLRRAETPETLRAYIDAANEGIAAMRATRDAAARRLEEIMAGRS